MAIRWKPDRALGTAIAEMDQQTLCRLVIDLCRALSETVGDENYRGGIYPENISRDEDGTLGIGPARRSRWDGQELQFVAPELYWNGECSPESDVYSLGLLLWYGLSGGKLPLEGESPLAQLSRMNGSNIKAPQSTTARLREIVETACRFRRSERFKNPRALAVVLESCLENKYFDGEEGEALFKKPEGELNEAEKMLLAILEGRELPELEPEPEEPEAAPAVSQEEPEAAPAASQEELEEAPAVSQEEPEETPVVEQEEPEPPVSREEAERLILAGNAPEKPAAPKEEPPLSLLVEEVFGTPEPAEPAPEEDDGEVVRVYEPGSRAVKEKPEPIPILTVEENPVLPPVVLKKREVHFGQDEERGEQIAREVKKRRTRPIGVVLVLCGLLIVAALVANHFLQNYEWEDEGAGKQVELPQVEGNAISAEEEFISVEELEKAQQEEQNLVHQSYYQIFPGDISWTNAKNEAVGRGGMLAVINSSDELAMITHLAEQSGMQGIWIGCHREGSYLIWETEEPTAMLTWASGEPSYTDSRDGAAEDFLMLWNTGGVWSFIDCRNDPVAADPNVYSGHIGYVCEFTD